MISREILRCRKLRYRYLAKKPVHLVMHNVFNDLREWMHYFSYYYDSETQFYEEKE